MVVFGLPHLPKYEVAIEEAAFKGKAYIIVEYSYDVLCFGRLQVVLASMPRSSWKLQI